MTKNRFLSKRLACLLTTALIASPVFLIQSKSAYAGAVNQDATVTASYADLDAVTLTAATATTTLTANDTAASFITTTTVPTAWGITANTLTLTGAITTTANAALTITLSGTGNLTMAGATVENATVGAMTIALGGRTFTTTGDVTHAAAISGAGAVVISGDTTFSDTIGTGTAVTTITTATGKTTTFSGAVNATGAVTATGTGNMTFAGNATAGSFSIGDGGSMSALSTTANTITGTIDGAAADKGTLVLNNSNAVKPIIASAVGSTNPLLMITATQGGTFNSNVSTKGLTVANAKVADFKGNLTLGSTGAVLTTGGATTFSGTSAQTVTGLLKGAGAGQGVVNVTNTEGVTFSNAQGTGASLLTLDVGTGASATLGANTNLIAEVKVGSGSTLNFGTGAFTNAGTLVTTVAANAALADVNAAAKIKLPANFVGGTTMNLFHTTDADMVATAGLAQLNTNVQDTPLVNYVVTKDGAANIAVVTATDKSASETASELGVNTNKALGLLNARGSIVTGSDTAALAAINTVLNAQTTTDTAFTNQIAPQTDTIAGSTVAAKAVTSGVQNIMSTRLASLRSGDAFSTGVVTGSGMSANSGFIQAFGSTVEQKNKGNEFGYDADTAGFALGIDGKVSDGVVVGISYANSKTDVDGKGTGKAKNDIKTNSGSIYADYTTKDGYVEGSITYGKSDNKGSRSITEELTRTYASNYDSEQYSFRLSGGVPINLGAGAFFTPFAGATISQIKTDAYTETSTTANDSLRLRVSQDTVDSQVGTVGIKYHQVIKDGKTTFTPEVKLALNQEFGDDTITSTNTYQGGGTSFKNSTAIEKTSATAGVGLNISSDNVSFNIGYEADVRDKYLGHSAQAKITAKF
jgi:uncharacterized protein with beta-barrel porin domain